MGGKSENRLGKAHLPGPSALLPTRPCFPLPTIATTHQLVGKWFWWLYEGRIPTLMNLWRKQCREWHCKRKNWAQWPGQIHFWQQISPHKNWECSENTFLVNWERSMKKLHLMAEKLRLSSTLQMVYCSTSGMGWEGEHNKKSRRR